VAREGARKLLDAGRERNDQRALGLGHATLSFTNLTVGDFEEVVRNCDECLRTAITRLDWRVGAGMKASAEIFLGQVEDGVSRLLELHREVKQSGWFYLASLMVGAVGIGLVLAGRIADGIRTLEGGISAADASGDRTMATWNRLFLAEVYLEMLGSDKLPPLPIMIKNVGAILRAKIAGTRRITILLEEAGRHPQLSDRGIIRARINMDIGLLHKLKKRPILARQFLERARETAELQGAALMVGKIDATLAELR
jgi:hypothetical protein